MKPILNIIKKVSPLCLLVSFCIIQAAGQGTVTANARKHVNNPDKALLAKFKKVCQQLDDFQGNYTMGGTLLIDDRSVPGNKPQKLNYMFCKQGGAFYYQMGKTITINEQGVYLYIDQISKSIMFSPQKEVNYDTRFKQFADVGKTIQSENYAMSSTKSGNEETIALVNEHHISCKQYAITFDQRTLKIRRLYARMTNVSAPQRTDNETVIDVRVDRWDDTADLTRFTTADRVIFHNNGRWLLKRPYKNYRLINM